MKTVKEQSISTQEMNHFSKAKYIVKTIVPLTKKPLRKTYIFNQYELNDFLENYNEYAEFIISVKVKKRGVKNG